MILYGKTKKLLTFTIRKHIDRMSNLYRINQETAFLHDYFKNCQVEKFQNEVNTCKEHSFHWNRVGLPCYVLILILYIRRIILASNHFLNQQKPKGLKKYH